MAFDAVVLLAGAGSRLATTHGAVPKPLVEVCGRPLVSYILQALELVGVTTVHAVVGCNAEEVLAGVEANLPAGVSLNAIHNREWQKQNGISVLSAAGAIERPFLLTMGDHLFDPSILRVLLDGADHSCLNLAVDRRIDAIFDLDDAMKVRTSGNRIVEIDKKLRQFDAIDTGLFLCPPALFDYLEKAKVQDDCSLADGVRLMARDNCANAIDIGARWWQDVDTSAMLRRAEECLPLTLRNAPQLVVE